MSSPKKVVDIMKVPHYDDYRAEIDEQMEDDKQDALSLCGGDCDSKCVCKDEYITYTVTMTRTEEFVEEVKARNFKEALEEVTLNHLDEHTVITSITQKEG